MPNDLHDNDLDYIFCPDKILMDGVEVRSYNVFLPTEIDDYAEIHDAIRLLRSYSVTDQLVTIYCRGFGGCTMIGNEIINAMNATTAMLRVIVSANCYSMHTTIAVSQAHRLTVEPNVTFMFHQVGTGLPVLRLTHAEVDIRHTKQIDEQLGTYLKPYLTKTEWDQFNNGLDVYVTGTELTKRIKKVQKETMKQLKIEAKLAKTKKESKNDTNETENIA